MDVVRIKKNIGAELTHWYMPSLCKKIVVNRSDHVHPIPGSNATVNKCGHCYTDPKEAKLFINNCGTCRNEPCCSEGDLDPCGNCPGQGTMI